MKLSNTKNRRLPTSPEPFANSYAEQALQILVGKIALGNREALAELYEHTRSLIYGLILRILGNHSSAEEVLLDVYLQVWHKAGSFDGGRGSLISWLITIARSRAIDRLRSEKHLRKEVGDSVPLRASAASPEDTSLFREQQRIVRSAFGCLPVEQRAVIEMAYFKGMTQTEIAEELACPLGTVKTRTRLAMNKLRDNLAPLLRE